MSDENGMRPDVALVRDGVGQSEPHGEEWGLVTDYLMGALNPTARREVDRRLMEDPAFRRVALPLMAAWDSPAPDEALQVTDSGMGWNDLRRRVAASGGELDESGAGSNGDSKSPSADVRELGSVTPAPWYEVVPPSWILRVGLTVAAVLAAIAWLVLFFLRHSR